MAGPCRAAVSEGNLTCNSFEAVLKGCPCGVLRLRTLEQAFVDLRGLMARAGEMVQLAERFRQALAERAAAEGEVREPPQAVHAEGGCACLCGRARLGREPLGLCMQRRYACLGMAAGRLHAHASAKTRVTPAAEQGAPHEEWMDADMETELISMGIASPVTKASAGALYHRELSRQVARALHCVSVAWQASASSGDRSMHMRRASLPLPLSRADVRVGDRQLVGL